VKSFETKRTIWIWVVGALAVFPNLTAIEASAAVERYKDCEELYSRLSPGAPARDARSREKYLESKKKRGEQNRVLVVVRPAVYRRNSHLDLNQNGILCEDTFEQWAGVALVAEITGCVLGGGKYELKTGICVGG
jgi:hypothetical protein